MHARFLQVENTVTFMGFTLEVKSYLSLLLFMDMIIGFMILLFECIHPIFDISNPQVVEVYQIVFSRKSFFLVSVLVVLLIMMSAKDNSNRLKCSSNNKEVLDIFIRCFNRRL